MPRPSPGPGWTILPGSVPYPSRELSTAHPMQEPSTTSPTPTTQSDANLGDDHDKDVSLNNPPAKRKAVEGPISVPRPPKVPRFNDNNQRDGRPQVSSNKRTNGAAPSSLTQTPNTAKKPRLSFFSQPTRPDKGKNYASSRHSTSSLSDHISNMVEKQNQRFRRVETARKSTRKRRATTSSLIRDVQRSSSGSEVSSAATRVRRASGKALLRPRPSLGGDVIELTDSSDATRRRRVHDNEPIVIMSSDADTPPRQPKPSQKPDSCRRPPAEAEVIYISDSDDDVVPAPPPATAVSPTHDPNIRLPLYDLELDATSELQQQTEELFSHINLDEEDNADQIASQIAQKDSGVTQDPPLPASDPLIDPFPVSKQATQTSLNDVVSVTVSSQLSGSNNLPHLESLIGSQTSISTPHPPSQTQLTPVPITTKPSVTWKCTPPSTNPFFDRALRSNAKVLKKPLPFIQTSSASTFPTTLITSPATIESSVKISPKSLVGGQLSDTPVEASSSVPPTISPSRDNDMSVKPPPADKTAANLLFQAESCGLGPPTSQSNHPHAREAQVHSEYTFTDFSEISAPLATARPSSAPIPVPPRIQRSTTKLTGSPAPSAPASKPHESTQPPDPTPTNAAGSVSAIQPAPFNETRTPSIQEIRDLIRQRPLSSKLSVSSAASVPSTPSAASNPSSSPPRSFTSKLTTPTTQSGFKPISRHKNRSMGVASLEMYISPIAGASQPTSSPKMRTPRRKRMSNSADKFRSIITPTADTSVRSQSLSPSEGRRLRSAAVSPGLLHTDADANPVISSAIPIPLGAPPERLGEPGATPSTSPSAFPLVETEAQKMRAEIGHAHEDIPSQQNAVVDLLRPEGIQDVTESIGSLDLRADSRSPKVDIDVDQVRRLSLVNGSEDGVQAIQVSAELMEHEGLESMDVSVDDVSAGYAAEASGSLREYRDLDEEDGDVDMRAIRTSAEHTSRASDGSGEANDQEELAVLMELEILDREGRDAEHPISISSSWSASSHAFSRQTPASRRSPEPKNVVGSRGESVAASMQQLEDGVEGYLGGYPIVTWKSYADAQRRLPPKYNLAKDLPHELQDRVNALPQSYRHSDQARFLFEAMIDEAMDDDLNAPPISVINDVTDEGAPPWEFVYTNQMWYGEGVPPPDIKNLKSCDCIGRCDPKSKTCSCAKRQHRSLKGYIEDSTIPKTWNGAPFVYDSKGCLQWFGVPIFECNAFCGCDEDCPNRVVQNGRRYVVNIKKTEHKGWGIFNGPKKIPRGSFIGVYAGELLTVGEADRRGTLYNKFGRTYLFDIDFHHMGSVAVYSVDAYHAGNLTRFLNHSCDPNCEIQACYINEANIDKPLLTVFTLREIEPFEELCFSYMGSIDDDTYNHVKASNDAVYAACHCGSANCLGVLFSG